jgi:hypothetical protein
MPIRALLALLGLLLASSPVAAGVVYRFESTGPGDLSEEVVARVDGPWLRIDQTIDGDPHSLIFRGDLRRMIAVDHADRSYVVVDRAAVEAFAGQLAAAQLEVERKILQLPPEQRGVVAELVRSRREPPLRRGEVEIRPSGELGEEQGYPVVGYDLLYSGKKAHELWVTDWENLPGGDGPIAVFREMASLYRQLVDPLAEAAAKSPDVDFDDAGFLRVDRRLPLDGFHRIKGFPVLVRSFGGDAVERRTVLQSVTEEPVDNGEFAPPEGYRPRAMGPR